MRRLLFILLLSGLVSLASAQVSVNNSGQTVAEAIQNSLIGEGVDVTNITLNGLPGNQIYVQAGTFEDPTESVGVGAGFIMGTGNVIMAEQPNTGGGNSLPGGPFTINDPDLEALTNVSVNDQLVIEFDFIPQGDTLTFNYIFASEEYPEFGCSSFNDVFGFFLSGNNPAGGIYNNENIALVPDPDNPDEYTDVPVAINSINDGMNGDPATCEAIAPDYLDYTVFYVDNQFGTDYEYDGRTVLLTARAIVNCGEPYHIKLAIGDGTDTAWDSAVFLEENSFSAAPTGITAESLFPLGLVEISDNCDEGFARIERPCAADTVYYVLNYIVNDSTAEYGVDYEPLPTEIMLPTFVLDTVFPIITIPDGITEDVEYICIELSEGFAPEGPFNILDTACIALIDNYTFDVAINNQVLWCPEDSPSFNANPQFPGFAPFQFEYFLDGVSVSTENPYEPPIPAQFDTVLYTLTVTDFCGAFNNPTEVFVSNMVRDDPTVSIGSTGQYCPGLGYDLTAIRTGGTGPVSYTWTDEFFNTYDNQQTVTVDPQTLYPAETEVTFNVLLEDACNPARTAEADIVVTYPEPLQGMASMNDVICTDQELELSVVSVSGGYPPYSYTWTADPQLLPPSDFPTLDGFVTNDFDGEGYAFGFFVPETESSQDFFITLEVNDWCSDSLTNGFIFPNYHPAALDVDTVEALDCIYPNVVSPNDDGSNDAFIINELINRPGRMFIYNRWGNLLVETNRHIWNISDEPEGTYYYVVQFDDGEDKKGYFTIVR